MDWYVKWALNLVNKHTFLEHLDRAFYFEKLPVHSRLVHGNRYFSEKKLTKEHYFTQCTQAW